MWSWCVGCGLLCGVNVCLFLAAVESCNLFAVFALGSELDSPSPRLLGKGDTAGDGNNDNNNAGEKKEREKEGGERRRSLKTSYFMLLRKLVGLQGQGDTERGKSSPSHD